MSKGEYTTVIDVENRIVRIDVSGEYDREFGEEIITHARMVAEKHQYRILYDVRYATAKVTLADWFFLPRTLAVLRSNKTRSIRAAVLISPSKQNAEYDFYETVTANLGMNLRVFRNEEKAIKWLIE